ncbi:GTP-binding protein [Anaerovibrio lipolyticus]|uniref:TIGR03943 family putative permease subunit n=1 Tax=Anaerovibrio lipolyticus TaxID=82374 RepID=UPI0023F39BA0|nr:GTP-binding protein [Anaerovibrio lipolyticus]
MSKEKPNVPVYYFMGLLESGKTSVIKDFLQNNQFAKAECNLIILGEEGEEEIDEELLQESHSKIIVVEDVEELSTEFYQELQKKYNPSSVLIEANGMWNAGDYMNIPLPEEWFDFQNIGMVNAETFEVYQKNMKDRFVDLFRYCELIIFNRCDHETRQQDIRRNVRVVNRRAQVIFESDLEDFVEEEPELPFSIDKDEIELELDDYGAWFVDMQDHPDHYDKKRIIFDGYLCSAQKDGVIHYGVGRVGMACCADDMMFLGISGTGAPFKQLNHRKNERKWGKVTGVIHVKYDNNGEIDNLKMKVEAFTEEKKPEDTIVYFN